MFLSPVSLVPQVCCELKVPEKVTPMLKILQGWWPDQDFMNEDSWNIDDPETNSHGLFLPQYLT